MTDTEKQELDRWLKQIGGEMNTWTTKDGTTRYEARAWKDGRVIRFLNTNRYQPIAALKIAWDAPSPANGAGNPAQRCASCPNPPSAAFTVRCNDYEAHMAGVTLTGPQVDTSWDGAAIREETVLLCQRCMAAELLKHLTAMREPAYWLKSVRSVP